MIDIVIILTFLILILLLCIKCVSKSNTKYDKRTFNFIKGIMVIFIVISHVYSRLNFLGPIACSVFLYFSGYGLEFKLEKDKKLKIFKIIELYIPFFLVNIFYLFYNNCFDKYTMLTFISTINVKFSWYVFEYIFLYLVFIFYNFVFPKYRDIVTCIFVVLMIPLLYFLGFKTWWYVSLLGFPLGIITYKLKNIKINLHYIIPLIVFLILFFYRFSLFNIKGIHNVVLLLALSITSSIFLMLFLSQHSIHNRFIEYIGSNSLTMYLFHPIFLLIFKFKYKFTYFVVSFLLAFLFSVVYRKIKEIVKKV